MVFPEQSHGIEILFGSGPGKPKGTVCRSSGNGGGPGCIDPDSNNFREKIWIIPGVFKRLMNRIDQALEIIGGAGVPDQDPEIRAESLAHPVCTGQFPALLRRHLRVRTITQRTELVPKSDRVKMHPPLQNGIPL